MDIYGMFGGSSLLENIPKEWKISGFMTDRGSMFTINKNNEQTIFNSDFYTIEQAEKEIKKYHRIKKLKSLNGKCEI